MPKVSKQDQDELLELMDTMIMVRENFKRLSKKTLDKKDCREAFDKIIDAEQLINKLYN